MSTIKSISVGNGDMFYIIHGSDNFTQIDCNANEENIDHILEDIVSAKKGKSISRFISTHPDQDHILGLKKLDEKIDILNFYCVKNSVPKDPETEDFKHYKSLRDGDQAYYISKGCQRKWMNQGDEDRGNAGINIIWPDTDSSNFIEALENANAGKGANNISAIITYSLKNGINAMWMGDLEKDHLDKIEHQVDWTEQDILFVPHHGRKSGKVPSSILEKINPSIVVIGEGKSDHLDYYDGYNSITQNSAKDIWFECSAGWVDIYVSAENYSVDYLNDRNLSDTDRNYIGSLKVS